MIRLTRSVLLAALLLAAALILARPVAPVVAQPARESLVVGEGPNRAALAVRFGDGQVDTVCVAFPEDALGGGDLLQRSGLALAMSPEGALCSINSEGCASDDCFCLCRTFDSCEYWAFYQWEGGQWVYSQFGVLAQSVVVRNGTMHGWSWGSGDSTTGAPPPDVTFDQVCPAAQGDQTATPTATATATSTFTPQAQPVGPTAAPQVNFMASSRIVPAQGCTTLSWSTLDATTVTLEGSAVQFSGSEQVCPQTAHTYTLIATNAVGQTSRQIAIQVTGSSAASPTPASGTPPQPGFATPRRALPTPDPRLIVTQPPQPLPTVGQPGLVITPDGGFATPGGFLAGGVPFAPTAEQLAPASTPAPLATPTRYTFVLPPTETPRPRRVLPAGGPTPTPLLMARAGGGSGQAPAAKAGAGTSSAAGRAQQLVQSRAFTPELLPQYAAYIVTVAALLLMGWFTLRRRGRTPISAPEPARDAGAGSGIAGKE